MWRGLVLSIRLICLNLKSRLCLPFTHQTQSFHLLQYYASHLLPPPLNSTSTVTPPPPSIHLAYPKSAARQGSVIV
ncbi:hypothetical protein L1987_63578 [Smallanthus sonchifolius]|uniref:Uncharacterized protein n=1 Tax=Smallanthus sonchifolius TaxID=185202 RepID=A0ACB9CDL8_9ASTR|nr:hypothetical protein L1987_63578 [Smallanthus sonchifolius]